MKLLDEQDSVVTLPPGVQPYPARGIVMYVGPGFRRPDGEYVALDIAQGDEVLFFPARGVQVMLGGEKLLLLRDEHVLLVSDPARVSLCDE